MSKNVGHPFVVSSSYCVFCVSICNFPLAGAPGHATVVFWCENCAFGFERNAKVFVEMSRVNFLFFEQHVNLQFGNYDVAAVHGQFFNVESCHIPRYRVFLHL